MKRIAQSVRIDGDGCPQAWYADCALYNEELSVYRWAWMRQEPHMYTDQMSAYGPRSVYEDQLWDG